MRFGDVLMSRWLHFTHRMKKIFVTKRMAMAGCYLLTITHSILSLSSFSKGQSVMSHLIDFELVHMTCFGQWIMRKMWFLPCFVWLMPLMFVPSHKSSMCQIWVTFSAWVLENEKAHGAVPNWAQSRQSELQYNM